MVDGALVDGAGHGSGSPRWPVICHSWFWFSVITNTPSRGPESSRIAQELISAVPPCLVRAESGITTKL